MHKRGFGRVGLISTGIVALSSFIFAPGTVVGVNFEINRSTDIVIDAPPRLELPKLSDLSKPLATRDGGFYCVGLSGDSAVLTQFDRHGNRLSDLTVTNNRVDMRAPAIIADSFQEDHDGNLLYQLYGSGEGRLDTIFRVHTNGATQENKNNGTMIPSIGQDLAAIIRTSDGGFLLGGTDFVSDPDSADYLLLKTDSAGAVEWTRRFGGSRVEILQSVEPLESGGYLLCGNSDSEGASGSKGVNGKGVWIIQTDSRGLKQSETIVPYPSWNVGLVRIPSGFAAIGFEGSQVVSAVHQIQLMTTMRTHVSARSEGGRPFSVDVSNDLTHWIPLVTRWTGDLEMRETFSTNNRFWRAYDVP